MIIGVPLHRISPAQPFSHLNTMKFKYIMQRGKKRRIEILVYIFAVQENCSVLNETRVLDGGLSAVLGVKFQE